MGGTHRLRNALAALDDRVLGTSRPQWRPPAVLMVSPIGVVLLGVFEVDRHAGPWWSTLALLGGTAAVYGPLMTWDRHRFG